MQSSARYLDTLTSGSFIRGCYPLLHSYPLFLRTASILLSAGEDAPGSSFPSASGVCAVCVLLCAVAAATARPGGLYDPWGAGAAVVAQPVVKSVAVAQPYVHAPATVAVAKPATSYSSFQQVVHPVSVAQPIVHSAPVISQPIVQAAPIVHAPAPAIAHSVVQAAPVYQSAPFTKPPRLPSRPVYQSAPVYQAAPVYRTASVYQSAPVVHAAPVVQTVSQPLYSQKLVSVGSYGHGWRHEFKMRAWSSEASDVMGPAVTRNESSKQETPPLKNGSDLRETGYLIAVGSRTARKSIKLIFQYVCGNWAEDHPRPDSYRSYDWFTYKQTKVYSVVRDFLGKNVTNAPIPVQQATDMYAACMDIDTLNKRGVQPVLGALQTLGLPPYPHYLNTTADFDYETYSFDWLETVIKVKTYLGMDVLIGFDLFTDPKNSSVFRLVMGSPETRNPFPSMHNERKRHTGRKYWNEFIPHQKPDLWEEYLEGKNDNDEKTQHLYRLYYAELIKIMFLEGGGPALTQLSEDKLDQNILETSNKYVTMYNDLSEFETSNDTDTEDELDLDIPEYTADELQAHTDMIVEANNGNATPIWRKYLEGVFNVSEERLDFTIDKILVSELDLKYMSLMAAYLATASPVEIELYIWMQVVEVMIIHTTTELQALHQRYYDELRGRSGVGVPARSLQCASAVNDMMGMAVAYAIADTHFLNHTKPKVQIMINEIKNALTKLVHHTKWMDEETKLASYEKIKEMKTLIGFPDWLLNDGQLEEYYVGVEVDRERHLENMINIVQRRIKKGLNKFRQPNNITWATDPTEVNAYHTFQENTISRKFDKNGNLLPWWTNETIELFVNKTQCFVDQYSTFYVPEIGGYMGKTTLGENIADNGGVREAFAALHEHLTRYGPELKLSGFEYMSSEQLFFLSYGNLWCNVGTKRSLESELEDEHSPQKLRARGVLQNNVDFAKAWKCPKGSGMNPETKCLIY
ncbi:Neprilysin-1 [Eumeta japonica]|uniref:Neprilysin-1 n=1 Tax=Eumeta variegata TaxID=151549 RepID=A0A4C1V274_EUMVA|nr:Neprilysin-1 [Eumeta japonica]